MKWILSLFLIILGEIGIMGEALAADIMAVLSNGDRIVRNGETITVSFNGRRNLLTSAVYGGGFHKDYQAVSNHCSNEDVPVMTRIAYQKQMHELCLRLGNVPEKTAVLGTSVPMNNAVLRSATYKDLTVTAIVTAGVEGNAGRPGDPAAHEGMEWEFLKPGTINIILHFNQNLAPGVMTRAVVMASEAKAAALEELQIGSRYSPFPATGTGTDQIAVISDPQGKVTVTDCGKHTKPGELVGTVVKDAVKEALKRQNGLDEQSVHSVYQRMRRFGITRESLQKEYEERYGRPQHPSSIEKALDALDGDDETVALCSLYAHLQDEWRWNLISFREFRQVGNLLLKRLAPEWSGTIEEREPIAAWKEAYFIRLHSWIQKRKGAV